MDKTKDEGTKPYPIYNETDEGLPAGMYLALFHGFEDQETRQASTDAGKWGANGPVFGPLHHVHTTYAMTIKLGFVKMERAKDYGLDPDWPTLQVDRWSECVHFDGMEYGDWTVYLIPDANA